MPPATRLRPPQPSSASDSCTGLGSPGLRASRPGSPPLNISVRVRSEASRHLWTHSALVDGASPTLDRVIPGAHKRPQAGARPLTRTPDTPQ